MDNPPQRIQIKRKRDHPAPDSLYLQPETESDIKSTSKRIRTENAFIFKRLILDPTTNLSPTSTAEHNGVAAAPVEPRRFRLSRSVIKSTAPIQEPHHTRKRRRDGDDLATFVELSPATPAAVADNSAVSIHNGTSQRPITPPLKRPTTQAIKLSRPLTPSKQHTEATVSKLQSMANEVTAAEALAARTTPKLKYNPIVPARRSKVHAPIPIPIPTVANPTPHLNKNDDTVDAMEIEDPSDYIVETYIRHVVTSSEPLPKDIGLLIIPASDEELWESYFDNELSSDEDVRSDDEDSNAEDWHGADYPEDELSDDDEMGEGAWKYYGKKKRRGSNTDSDDDGSDEEEWGYKGSEDGDNETDWRTRYI